MEIVGNRLFFANATSSAAVSIFTGLDLKISQQPLEQEVFLGLIIVRVLLLTTVVLPTYLVHVPLKLI